jgi:hypothetical protein
MSDLNFLKTLYYTVVNAPCFSETGTRSEKFSFKGYGLGRKRVAREYYAKKAT